MSVGWRLRVVPGRYADSVRLMAVAREVRGRDGVRACEIGMGTPVNLAALADLGVRAEAGPGDLVIAVDAEGDAAEDALAAAEAALGPERAPAAGGPEEAPPRTATAALAALPGANLAMVSVPGEYATLEAHRALSSGLHVFLFSDHVPERDEVALKRRGAARGLLVMGPECGTAMLGGVGLGFANVVRRGPVGIVAAAGTGAQETACLLDASGVGVSQIVGVGGRDLSEAVGGIMFRQGMRALADDPQTETLVLVSKPPAPRVVRALADALPRDVRVVAAFVGWTGDAAPFEVHPTLEAGALAAAGRSPRVEADLDDAVAGRAAGRRLLGLFSGGSLAYEALTILEPVLGPIGGNLTGRDPAGAHAILDLGEEEYTRGRPHPMVDLQVRLEMLRVAADDADLGCVLFDLVLGHGAHPDPAPELAPTLAELASRVPVVARVCGTAADPQDARRQERELRGAGVVVAPSNAAAARLAGLALTGAPG